MAHQESRPTTGTGDRAGRTQRRSHAWLLLVPLVVTLFPPLYNRASPHLAGIPFFYWYQLAVIVVGVTCTYAVHRRTRDER